MSKLGAMLKIGIHLSYFTICVNMEKTSSNARWTVYDHMLSSNVKVSEFVVKKELLQSCKAAHSKYTAHLKETKKEKVKEKEGNMEINHIFLLKLFWYMIQNSRQKL